MATPRTAWGIDVGNRALKAVKLVRGANGIRIDDVVVIEHEHVLSNAGDNKESLIQAALNQFAQTHPTKGALIGIGVSGQQSFARFIKLPPVEPRKVPEIVRFEAIQQIPFPLDEVEWSYQLFSDESSPDVEVGIFAMRRELVNRHIEFFTSVGLDVNLVQMSPLAVYNAMNYDQRLKGTTMIIDIGAENTDLIIAEGESVWLRSIPIGGNNFTEALTKSFKLRFEKAEELKRNAATSKYARQILQAMRPVFADLVSEIQRSIGFYASVHRDSRIGRVIALGGTFRLPGLQKYLQQNLQLEVHRLDRLSAGAPDEARTAAIFNENLLSTVPAYGLALQAMSEGKITSSLLPQKIQRERMWRDKTKWFAVAAGVAVVAVGVEVGRIYYDQFRYDQTKGSEAKIDADLRRATGIDKRWQEIESNGAPERKLIADINTLAKGHTVQAGLLQDIMAALPDPGADIRSGEKDKILKAQPTRGKRRYARLEQLASKYEPDLTATLALPDTQFNANESLLGAQPGTGSGFSGGNMPTRPGFGGGSNPYPMVMPGRYPTMPGPGGMPMSPMAPTAPKPGNTEDGAAAAQPVHGYIIALRFTTPYSQPGDIGTSIKNALEAANPKPGEPPKPYKIEKVRLASASKMTPPDKNAIQSMIAGRPQRGGVAGFPNPIQVRPKNEPPKTGGAKEGPPKPMRPGAGTGGVGVFGNPDEEKVPFNDPVTGEPLNNDSQFTLVVAVSLDPPPPAAPASTEGGAEEKPAEPHKTGAPNAAKRPSSADASKGSIVPIQRDIPVAKHS